MKHEWEPMGSHEDYGGIGRLSTWKCKRCGIKVTKTGRHMPHVGTEVEYSPMDYYASLGIKRVKDDCDRVITSYVMES